MNSTSRGFHTQMGESYMSGGYARPLHTHPLGSSSKIICVRFEATGPYLFATNKKFYFRPDTELDMSTIYEIELLDTGRIIKTPLPERSVADDHRDAILVLADHSGREIARHPLMDLSLNQNNNMPSYTHYQNLCIGKSYIIFRTNTWGFNANYGVALLFKYGK